MVALLPSNTRGLSAMRLGLAAIVVVLVTGCAGADWRHSNAPDDSFELFLAQQRLQQQVFLRDLKSYRVVQCLPVGFAVDCH
jgi:hypothetical protein